MTLTVIFMIAKGVIDPVCFISSFLHLDIKLNWGQVTVVEL